MAAFSTSPRIALVTGANKGIGLATAEELAAQGFQVILTARDAKLGNEAATKVNAKSPKYPASFIQLQVDDQASVDAAAAEVSAKFGRLDALVNNAGVFNGDKASEVTQKVLLDTFKVNFFGQIYVTQKFLPLLKLSAAPRIVFISTGLASLTKQSDPTWEAYSWKYTAYNTSKSALNAYVVHLAAELKDTAFKVNTLHPGLVLTEMNPIGKGITPSESAQFVAKYATLPSDGPTGGFYGAEGQLEW